MAKVVIKEDNMCTLIHGIKAIHELTRTKINADVINANARKVCLVDHKLTRTGRAKVFQVPKICGAFSPTLSSYLKYITNISCTKNRMYF